MAVIGNRTSIEDLLMRWGVVHDETTAGANSKTRIGQLGADMVETLSSLSFPMGEKISTIEELDGDEGARVGVHAVNLDKNHPVFGYNYFSLITLPTDGDDAGESQLAIVPPDDLSSPTKLYIRTGSSDSRREWTLVNGGGITDLGVISDWGNIVDTGIYKYKFIAESGITGLLFVTSSPKKNGSGRDYFQYRLEYGKIYKRTGASVVTGRYEWGEWQTGLSASDISYDNMGSEGQEGYTNVQNAINGLFVNKMSSPIEVLETKEKVDNCITPGSYGVTLFGDPDPLFGEQFSLLVLNVNGDGDIYMQLGIKASDDNHIMAIREGSSGSWTEWKEVGCEGSGFTDLGTKDSLTGLDQVQSPGAYTYKIEQGTKSVAGFLLVSYDNDSAGVRYTYQTRFEGGSILSRSLYEEPNAEGVWSEWKKISSVSVVQSTGTSTTAVMSQKAVTDEIKKGWALVGNESSIVELDYAFIYIENGCLKVSLGAGSGMIAGKYTLSYEDPTQTETRAFYQDFTGISQPVFEPDLNEDLIVCSIDLLVQNNKFGAGVTRVCYFKTGSEYQFLVEKILVA